MSHESITSPAKLAALCSRLASADRIGIDTEFVSEYTHRPELCLLQFATRERCVAVDPYAVTKLDAWWELMADSKTAVIVHGGREEVRFCLTHCGRPPGRLWDVQIAEGLRSRRGRPWPLESG